MTYPILCTSSIISFSGLLACPGSWYCLHVQFFDSSFLSGAHNFQSDPVSFRDSASIASTNLKRGVPGHLFTSVFYCITTSKRGFRLCQVCFFLSIWLYLICYVLNAPRCSSFVPNIFHLPVSFSFTGPKLSWKDFLSSNSLTAIL